MNDVNVFDRDFNREVVRRLIEGELREGKGRYPGHYLLEGEWLAIRTEILRLQDIQAKAREIALLDGHHPVPPELWPAVNAARDILAAGGVELRRGKS